MCVYIYIYLPKITTAIFKFCPVSFSCWIEVGGAISVVGDIMQLCV